MLARVNSSPLCCRSPSHWHRAKHRRDSVEPFVCLPKRAARQCHVPLGRLAWPIVEHVDNSSCTTPYRSSSIDESTLGRTDDWSSHICSLPNTNIIFMHSVVSRINGVWSLLTSCTAALLVAVALSSLFLTADPKGTVDVVSLKVSVYPFVHPTLPTIDQESGTSDQFTLWCRYNAKAKRYPYKEQEFGFVKFDVDAGMSSLFIHLLAFAPCLPPFCSGSSFTDQMRCVLLSST